MRLPAGLRGASWSIVDQGVYSLSNVLLAVLVARQVSAEEFGAFSTVYILYVCSQGVNEGIHGEAFSVAYSAADARHRRHMLAGAAGSALVFGAVLGLACVALGAVVPGPIGELLPVLGAVLPGLFLQDLWRFALFAEHLPRAAALNDVIWGGGSTLGVIVLARTSFDTVGWFLAAWGAAGAGLLVGGSLGNLVDRLRFGGVTDFIDFDHWPAFNIADSAITIGAILIIMGLMEATEEPDR